MDKKQWAFANIALFWILVGAQLGLGLHLLLRPVAPVNLQIQWGEQRSRSFMRILAILLLLSLLLSLF